MKKIILLGLVLTIAGSIVAQTNFYQLAVTNVLGNPISLTAYAGQKVFITVCSAANPDLRRLKALDSLSRSNPNFKVIVIPVQDFDATPVVGSALTQVNASLKKMLQDSLQVSFKIASTAMGKKTSGNQQPLLAWLTNKNGNSHFDYDLSNVWQTFVINEHGTLFAVLEGVNDISNNYTMLLTAQVSEQ